MTITSIEKTDRTLNRKNKLYLENRETKNQITYSFDTLSKTLTTKKYLIETFYSLSDADTTIKTRIKQKQKKWRYKIPEAEFAALIKSLKLDVDSLKKNMTHLHTSHHYLNISINIISNKDTISYTKAKPFEYTTPWHTNAPPYLILNPSIDKQIAQYLPEEFLCREKLMLKVSGSTPIQ
jgi:hypothetical protein